MTADEALRRAAGQLRNEGAGTVWMPQVTTGQVARSGGLLARAQRVGAGARTFNADQWFVWYTGDALPDADTPAWTPVSAGTPTASVGGGLLNIVTNAVGESLYYVLAEATLANTRGTTVEAAVRVNNSAVGVDKGAALSIRDGVKQFTVWLRADGLNVDGGADCPCVLSNGLHRVKVVAKGTVCRVWLDSHLWAQGAYCDATADQEISFGSYAESAHDPAQSDADWDFVRAMVGG